MTVSVTFSGFKTEKQALEFISWYEGGGEQFFYDHLQTVGLSTNNGCNVDVQHKGNHKYYIDRVPGGFMAKVR